LSFAILPAKLKRDTVAVTTPRRRLGLEFSEGWAEHVLANVEERAIWARYGL